MTKIKGESNLEKVKKELSKLTFTSRLSNIQGSNIDLKYIQNEFSKVWSLINTNPGDFVIVQVNIYNGLINVVVIRTNLDIIRVNKFLDHLKSIDTKNIKNLRVTIDFKSKLKD